MMNVGLKMGSRYVYSLLGFGVHPVDKGRSAIIAGFGGHVDFHPIWLEVDLSSHFLQEEYEFLDEKIDLLNKFRAVVGWRFVEQFSVYLGPTLNFLISEERESVALLPDVWNHKTDSGSNLALTIGFVAGLSFEPTVGLLNSHGR